tara:strand:+ start:527 stop:670 length:144 start_codon:yes stop_codon:yes gene_type:complete
MDLIKPINNASKENELASLVVNVLYICGKEEKKPNKAAKEPKHSCLV